MTGALTDHGVGTDDAHCYEERINNGGVFVSVDTANGRISGDTALDIMNRAGGHGSGRAKLHSTI